MSRARQIGAQVYIAGMALAAVGCIVFAVLHRQPTDPAKFAFYLVAAVVASSLKVSLPGIEGTMSMNFLLTLLCILELGLPETLLIGLVKTLAQFYWRPARQLKLVQLLFNLSQVTVCSAATWAAYKLFSVSCVSWRHSGGPDCGGDHALRLQYLGDVGHYWAHGREAHLEGLDGRFICGRFPTIWWERPWPAW